jgi:predicted amino acid dehydrogenase
MYYQGDVQSGIATALREAKKVVCFIHDDAEHSNQWENVLLQDMNVGYVVLVYERWLDL